MTPELYAGFGALTTVVGLLWIRFEYQVKRMENKLDACEKDRAELWKELAKR